MHASRRFHDEQKRLNYTIMALISSKDYGLIDRSLEWADRRCYTKLPGMDHILVSWVNQQWFDEREKKYGK
jgi:hypothetical protein